MMKSKNTLLLELEIDCNEPANVTTTLHHELSHAIDAVLLDAFDSTDWENVPWEEYME